MNRAFQSISIYIGLGFCLTSLGLGITDSMFWCIVTLFWLAEFLAREEGKEKGILLNGMAVKNLVDQRDELIEKLKKYEQHSRSSEQEQSSL